MILLYGRGTDLTDRKAIHRRAKAKMIARKTMLNLIDVAKEKGANDRVKAYWNTYYCQDRVYTANSRLYTSYCKNRFCAVCSGIRKAELINKYFPVLQSWEAPYFVTLTIKAVTSAKLASRIKAVKRALGLIVAKHRKRSERGTGIRLIGLTSIECCFNPKIRTYNPHLHILVPNKQTADILINEWLSKWGTKFTHRDAQHSRRVEDRAKDLIEVIKYETKIFTEPDGKNSRGKKGSVKIYIRALDNINAAFKGSRLIDRFGFKLPTGSNRKKTELKVFETYEEWQYHSESNDWLNAEHESTLTNYNPARELMILLENNIDLKLE